MECVNEFFCKRDIVVFVCMYIREQQNVKYQTRESVYIVSRSKQKLPHVKSINKVKSSIKFLTKNSKTFAILFVCYIGRKFEEKLLMELCFAMMVFQLILLSGKYTPHFRITRIIFYTLSNFSSIIKLLFFLFIAISTHRKKV